jgi:hypothetical protein
VVRTPQRQAHVNSAMEVANHLLQGMPVSLRRMCQGGAKDAQRRSNIMTYADCRVLKVAEEAWVDVLSLSCEGRRGVYVC